MWSTCPVAALGLPAAESHDTKRATAIPPGAAVPIKSIHLGGGQAVYLAGAAGGMRGDLVVPGLPRGSVTRCPAAGKSGAAVAVALADIEAGQYGFFQTRGCALVRCSGTPAPGDPVYIGGTGDVTDAQRDGVQILGAVFVSAIDVVVGGVAQTGMALIEIRDPHCQGQIV